MAMSVKKSGDGKKLIIEMDLETPRKSKSGNTMVVASTRGNQVTDVHVKHGKEECAVVIGINAYIKPSA